MAVTRYQPKGKRPGVGPNDYSNFVPKKPENKSIFNTPLYVTGEDHIALRTAVKAYFRDRIYIKSRQRAEQELSLVYDKLEAKVPAADQDQPPA